MEGGRRERGGREEGGPPLMFISANMHADKTSPGTEHLGHLCTRDRGREDVKPREAAEEDRM